MSSVKLNCAFLFIGNLVYAACQWGILVVYAKLGTPELVGQFALATAVITPVIMFTNLHLRALISTDAAGRYHLDDFLAIRFFSIAVFIPVILLLGLLFFRDHGIMAVLMVLAAAKAIESVSDVLYGYFQKHERMSFVSWSMIIKGILSLAGLAFLFAATHSLAISLAGLACIWLGVMLVFDMTRLVYFEDGHIFYSGLIDFIRRISKSITERRGLLVEILRNGACLGVVMGLISFNSNVPRYVIEQVLGARELGFFSAMAYTTVAISMFVMSVGQGTSPKLARFFEDGNKEEFAATVWRNITVISLCGAAALIVVIFFGPQLLALAYTKEYAMFNDVFILIILASVISAAASMLGFALTAVKSYFSQVPIFVLVLFVNWLLCYFLVPMLGLAGAAWAMISSFLLQALLSAWLLSMRVHSFRTPQQKAVVKVLHIVGGMDTGGVETWLMHVLRNTDKAHYKIDFLSNISKPCFYDNEIKSLGCKVLQCQRPANPLQYAFNFFRIIREHGPYDVVHSHVHYFSGYTLLLARLAGVGVRIAHSHNDTSIHDNKARGLRKAYLSLSAWLIKLNATTGLACSEQAADNLFGSNWRADKRWRILYCALDLGAFTQQANPDDVRRELGIPQGAFVVGHVGRFAEQKNHDFLIGIFSHVLKRIPQARLLLVGDGPLRNHIETIVDAQGLGGNVIFAGVRSDVPRLLLGAMDVFVFPSHFEGLPLILIEVQASGLPVVMSDVISPETIVSSQLVKRVSLKQTGQVWADEAMEFAHYKRDAACALQRVAESRFNLSNCVAELTAIYSSGGA